MLYQPVSGWSVGVFRQNIDCSYGDVRQCVVWIRHHLASADLVGIRVGRLRIAHGAQNSMLHHRGNHHCSMVPQGVWLRRFVRLVGTWSACSHCCVVGAQAELAGHHPVAKSDAGDQRNSHAWSRSAQALHEGSWRHLQGRPVVLGASHVFLFAARHAT